MRVEISPLAERDLEAIGDYIADDNPPRALSFVAELRTQCAKIAKAPQACRARPELGEGIRSCDGNRGRSNISTLINDMCEKSYADAVYVYSGRVVKRTWFAIMRDDLLPYEIAIKEARTSGVQVAEYLRKELPNLWRDAYLEMTPRLTNIVLFTHGTFDYIYDDYATLEATGVTEPDSMTESRLVAAVGVSQPNPVRRDDSRLRGWVGPTGETFGEGWDKGHFIAHSIGGAVDGLEANVFLQLRSVNRGEYRKMEKYCAVNPGVLCFSRPIYGDPSAKPTQVEFGVLKPDGELWIQVFNNRYP